jgi:hypothetical protein
LPSLSKNLPNIPLESCTELLHTLLLAAKHYSTDKDRAGLLAALRTQFDSAGHTPLALLPYLYPDHPVGAEEVVRMAGKAGSLLEGALPDLVLEMGYHFTSSVEECRASLLQLGGREVYAATVAKVLIKIHYKSSTVNSCINAGTGSSYLGMHRISGRIIRPFLISGTRIRPDTRLPCRISGKAGYRISGYCLADPIIYLVFLQIRQEKKFAQKLI